MAAVFPVAAGLTSYSGILIPEVWAGKALIKFYQKTVFAAVSNTDYQGEIKSMGDTVHIRTIPDIIIKSYSIGMKLTYTRPNPTVVDLLIDKGDYYAFPINPVEIAQADMKYVEDWTSDAGEQLGITTDTAILGDVYADAHADNAGATAGAKSSGYNMGATGAPLAFDKASAIDILADCSSVLSEQNVPMENRWVVLAEILCNRIAKSDLKDASMSGDGTSIMRNGMIGKTIAGMAIHSSNAVEITSDGGVNCYNNIFGHKSAVTFASQLVSNERLKNPDDFGDLLRGLQVYGYETIKSEALGHLYAKAA